jgi:hypothetical protein
VVLTRHLLHHRNIRLLRNLFAETNRRSVFLHTGKKRKHVEFDLPTVPPSPPAPVISNFLTAPEDIADEQERATLIYTLLAIRYVTEPRTFRKAMTSTHADQWLQAAKSEIKSHAKNGTWIIVPRPKGRRILRNRWVWVVKHNGNSEVDRF